MKYKKIAIVGTGLIGGSIGLDIREKGLSKEIAGWGRNPDHLRQAVEKGVCTTAGTSLEKALRGAEIIILSTPVEIIIRQLAQIEPFVEDGALVMDVGSVKENIVKAAYVSSLITEKKEFMGTHPMAGSEKTGVANSSVNLFRGAPCIIAPHEKNSSSALERAKSFWNSLGAGVEIMSPCEHDRTVGFLSHLPHILSTVLSKVCGSSIKDPRKISRTAGPSFRDLTRIAGASPSLWSQIYLQNRNHVTRSIDVYIDSLKDLRRILSCEEKEELTSFIEEGRLCREKIKFTEDAGK